MKFCRKCNIEKDDSEFYKHKRVCKICYNEHNRLWKLENKDLVKSISRNLYLKHKESRREPRRKYAAERRKTDVLFALRSNISSSIRQSFDSHKVGSKKSVDVLGCSFEEFKVYLESKFESWMTWGNRGLYNGGFNHGWDIDHIIPSSSAKSKEEIIKLNHYTNFQPLCSKINREIKKDKIFK